MEKWSKSEMKLLKEIYCKTTNDELIKIFKRTKTSIYRKANRMRLRKNSEIYFADRSNARAREKSSNWKGGEKITSKGYVVALKKDHPNCDKNGYIMKHRIIMEEKLGRYLQPNEIIHHINKIKDDNRIENLELMKSGEHTILHHKGKKHSKETKKKMSKKAKERFKSEENHPSYKDVNIVELYKEVKNGKSIKQVCKGNNISTVTYYNKLRKWRKENESSNTYRAVMC